VSRIRIATRESALALAQSRGVGAQLERALGVETELVPTRTSGDRLSGPLAKLGGKGLFVKEVEEAVLDGRADLAVHSAKDLPARLAPGLALAAFPERADPRDALVTREPGVRLASLREGARVGTGSLRRCSQLLALRPDLRIESLRGNVGTRLRKLESGALDAVVLACAGLERLGLADRIGERIACEALLPAVGQGTLALEARAGSSLADDLLALDHAPTRIAVSAERAFLQRLAADCNVPLAALAEPADGGRVALRGLLASLDGREVLRASADAAQEQAAAAGQAAAESLLRQGGDALLAAFQAESAS
jgi:hydroxymethylbilane synthase